MLTFGGATGRAWRSSTIAGEPAWVSTVHVPLAGLSMPTYVVLVAAWVRAYAGAPGTFRSAAGTIRSPLGETSATDGAAPSPSTLMLAADAPAGTENAGAPACAVRARGVPGGSGGS